MTNNKRLKDEYKQLIESNAPEDYLFRMYKEWYELQERFYKLHHFTNKPEYLQLSDIQAGLLQRQKNHMFGYLTTLEIRIDNEKKIRTGN